MEQSLWKYLEKSRKPVVLYGMGDGADKIIKVLESRGIEYRGVFATDGFVRDPNEVVKPQQKVNVCVLEVDKLRNRISLSMKSNPQRRVQSAGDMARGNAKAKSFGGGNRGNFQKRQGGGNLNSDWTSALDNFKF